MNLAELTEVLEGVRKAQAKEGGENVAAALSKTDDKGLLVHDENLGTFTVVDFDVSVVAEAKYAFPSQFGSQTGIRRK